MKSYSFLSLMATKTITKVALMACILFIVFTSFSSILYIEMITLVVAVFAMVFRLQESLFAVVVFAILNMFVQGITVFSLMYLFIYPAYTMLIYYSREFLLKHRICFIVLVSVCSFATGMLLDLPFMLFSNKLTFVYLLLGFKTSLIQATITGIITSFVFDQLYRTLVHIERKY